MCVPKAPNTGDCHRNCAVTGIAPNTPSWMKPWLERGDSPPGYVVEHRKPLSVGGEDAPTNMRLQREDIHNTHHKYYRPWED